MNIPPDTLCLADYQRHFSARVQSHIAAYIDGFAADGMSVRANEHAFAHLKLLPRRLRSLKEATTQLTLLGENLPTPIIWPIIAWFTPKGKWQLLKRPPSPVMCSA